MKIIKRDPKQEEMRLKVENSDDIWVLSQIIEPEDLISGSTERKIKIGDAGTDRNVKIVKKWVTLTIKTEKTEIDENYLRVLGVITDGPDDIARGEHHSFKLEPETVFKIKKTKWLNYQIEKINEATKSNNKKILIIVFDREEAYFAKLKGQGYQIMTELKGDVAKKESQHVSKENFYKEIIKTLDEYEKKDPFDHIILASPGFWKEELQKVLPEEYKKKSVFATVSGANERAIIETIKRPELKKVLEASRAGNEIKIIDKILQAISKEIACYGIKETKEQIRNGAVEEIAVSYNLLQKSRDDGSFKEIENIMKQCEANSGKVHVISTEDAKKVLDSIAGIAGILRWKN